MQIINANYFFTAAFTIEVLLQSIAKNFILGPNGKPEHSVSKVKLRSSLHIDLLR